MASTQKVVSGDASTITLFLCGDVMTGRGIDQVLPYPSNPQFYEPYATSAETYVRLAEVKQNGDWVVASIHWGGNWVYEISNVHRQFAHRLIDQAHVDVVHGHSSHHPKGIEVYRDKAIIFGCGDFLNDYEGISGHEEFRGDIER